MKKVDTKLAKLVVKEATKLRQKATKEELNNLSVDLNDLRADNRDGCIYGQMTGDCFSKRANKLIVKCAERVYSIDKERSGSLFDDAKLNGKPKKTKKRIGKYFSPIEMYIYLSNSKKGKKALLQYIKGIKDTLEHSELFKSKKVLAD
jgi:hypothetical protein